MTNLVKRLRNLYAIRDKSQPEWETLNEAADRIEELEKSWRVLISKKEEQERHISELERTLSGYLYNANARMVMGFDFDKGEYPVASETISILCAENAELRAKLDRVDEFRVRLMSVFPNRRSTSHEGWDIVCGVLRDLKEALTDD